MYRGVEEHVSKAVNAKYITFMQICMWTLMIEATVGTTYISAALCNKKNYITTEKKKHIIRFMSTGPVCFDRRLTFDQGHGTVLQFHHHSIEGIHHGRDVQQSQNEGL